MINLGRVSHGAAGVSPLAALPFFNSHSRGCGQVEVERERPGCPGPLSLHVVVFLLVGHWNGKLPFSKPVGVSSASTSTKKHGALYDFKGDLIFASKHCYTAKCKDKKNHNSPKNHVIASGFLKVIPPPFLIFKVGADCNFRYLKLMLIFLKFNLHLLSFRGQVRIHRRIPL